MNYKHKEWQQEDREYINDLVVAMKRFQQLEEKYAFDHRVRIQFSVTVNNLLDLIKRLKEQFKEQYA